MDAYIKEMDTEIISLFLINDLMHFPNVAKLPLEMNLNNPFLFLTSFCLLTRLVEMVPFLSSIFFLFPGV